LRTPEGRRVKVNRIKKRGFGTHKDQAKIQGARGGAKSRGGGVSGDSKRASQIAHIRWEKWRADQAEREIREAKNE